MADKYWRDKALAIAKGMREMADYIEAHKDIEIVSAPDVYIFCQDKAELAEKARLHAPLEKVFAGDWFHLRKSFGAVEIKFHLERAKVCKQVVVGTRQTVKPIYAPAEKIGEETVTEEIKEWRCTEPLLSN